MSDALGCTRGYGIGCACVCVCVCVRTADHDELVGREEGHAKKNRLDTTNTTTAGCVGVAQWPSVQPTVRATQGQSDGRFSRGK
jgi:hypothetical protein